MRTSPSEAVLVAPVDEQRDHIQGSADAPVTVVQYGDYECPYCGQAYPIIKQIQRRMGTGSGSCSGTSRSRPRTDESYELDVLLDAVERAAADR
jgi:hypothetical protein